MSLVEQRPGWSARILRHLLEQVMAMLDTVKLVMKRIWRGTWRPLWPLPSQPRWYHYADYWARRPNDYIITAMIPLIPAAMGFLLYRDGSIHPYLLTLQVSMWLGALALAYYKGRDVTRAR